MSEYSVHSLKDSVYLDRIPNSPSVCADYGFYNCKTQEELTNLFGVYVGLIKIIECDLMELHQECIKGKLADFIVQKYGSRRSHYYNWFLNNKQIVDNFKNMR
jgi:hypothetical protein